MPVAWFGPDHSGPAALPDLSLKLREADLPAMTASMLPSRWWRLFDDANLDRLAD